MQQAPEFVVWFPRLEDLLDTHVASEPVYCAANVVSQPPDEPALEEHWINAADIQEGVCRYWRMRIAAIPLQGVLRPDPEVIAARVRSAVEALDRIIKSKRFRSQRGLVSLPADIVLQAGDTGLIAYDRLADLWRPWN